MATFAIGRFGLSTALSRLTRRLGAVLRAEGLLESQIVGRANSEGHDGMGKQCGNWSKIATVENPTRFAANMTARPHSSAWRQDAGRSLLWKLPGQPAGRDMNPDCLAARLALCEALALVGGNPGARDSS